MKALKLRTVLVVVAIYGARCSSASPSTGAPAASVVKLQISEDRPPQPLWLDVIDKLVWPIIVGLAIVTLRKPAAKLLDAFAKRGTDISIGAVAIRLPAIESKVADQQGQINLQTEQINQLITFSMSWYIYEMLFQIHQAKEFGGKYFYRNDGSMDRNLRFLIDHGYIQEIYEWPKDGEEMTNRIQFTRAGQALISMRGLPGNSAELTA